MVGSGSWTSDVFRKSIVLLGRGRQYPALPVTKLPVDARIAVRMKGGGVFHITFVDPKKRIVLISGGYFRRMTRLYFAGASEGEHHIVSPKIVSGYSMMFRGIHKNDRILTILVADLEWLPREWLLIRVFNRARFMPDDFFKFVSRTFKKAKKRAYA